jgi:hypothetical protein
MRKVFCFGNEFYEKDNLAVLIGRELNVEGFIFLACDNPNILAEEKNPIIIDVVKDLSDVRLIDDIDRIIPPKINTMHDFDLGFHLKLLKEIGEIDKITIIGIPMAGDKEKIKKEVNRILRSLK